MRLNELIIIFLQCYHKNKKKEKSFQNECKKTHFFRQNLDFNLIKFAQ